MCAEADTEMMGVFAAGPYTEEALAEALLPQHDALFTDTHHHAWKVRVCSCVCVRVLWSCV